LQVQIDAVKQARVQLESNQRLVAQGVLAPIDVVAATTQITTFEQSVYTAQESVTRAENNLKMLMLADRSAPEWTRPITPVSGISLEPPRVELSAALGDALQNRPEIAQLQTQTDINRIDQRYLRDQTKPQIDLIGNYTSAGLTGTANEITRTSNTVDPLLLQRINQISAAQNLPPLVINPTTSVSAPPDALVGNYFNSLGNILTQRYPTYRVGVRISLPLGNRVAEANLGRSLAEETQIQNTRAQTEQVIEAQVRNALQALRSAEARLASALAARQSAEQLFESEQRQFRAGTTTFYLVLQRQTELLAARGRELQSQTDLNKAISEFQRATGTTLSANNVTVTKGANLIKSPLRRTIVYNSGAFGKGK
jgi:HAE1 family hydrophobic/amphiphilic exporter-1